MSAHDDEFPDSPPPPRKPVRRGVQPSDFNDPTVQAKARALHAASAGSLDGLAVCSMPMMCMVGDHAHRLVIGSHWPEPGERRHSHQRTWEWDDEGQAWKCVAVHSRG